MQLIGQRTHPSGHLARTIAHQHNRGYRFGHTKTANMAEGPGRLRPETQRRTLAGLAFRGIKLAPAHRSNLTRASLSRASLSRASHPIS